VGLTVMACLFVTNFIQLLLARIAAAVVAGRRAARGRAHTADHRSAGIDPAIRVEASSGRVASLLQMLLLAAQTAQGETPY